MNRLVITWIKRLMALFRRSVDKPKPVPLAVRVEMKDKTDEKDRPTYIVKSPGRPVRFADGQIRYMPRGQRRRLGIR